ncbi:hypothetical protein [Thalassotalea sp. ND16A]|uniref:hypothetical protein n=1 Tax=Thalassotalea sp. ND16A TaxID=1535422 RepID=UPI00051DB09F|nr:hypothetical protein [Thalassotalea sp. ND16A]KGJ92486.1 hypothetical protein ND16A_1664 [Thalassotalea sp. ND16A]
MQISKLAQKKLQYSLAIGFLIILAISVFLSVDETTLVNLLMMTLSAVLFLTAVLFHRD